MNFVVGLLLRPGARGQGRFRHLRDETDDGQIVFASERQRRGLLGGGEFQRDVIRRDDRAVRLFGPVAACEFAAIESKRCGQLGDNGDLHLAADRVGAAGTLRGLGRLRPRQASHLGIGLQRLRQRERRNPDFHAGPAVVATQQRQHDRSLPVETIAIVMAVIGADTVLDRLAKLRVGPPRRRIAGGERFPADRSHLLAEEIERRVERERRDAAEIGPVLVEHDIGRIGRERYIGGDPVGGVVHHRLVGPPEALREMNVKTLLSLLESQEVLFSSSGRRN